MHQFQQLLVHALAAAEMIIDGRSIRTGQLTDLFRCRGRIALFRNDPARTDQQFFLRGPAVIPLVLLFHSNRSFSLLFYHIARCRNNQPASGIVTAATASMGT